MICYCDGKDYPDNEMIQFKDNIWVNCKYIYPEHGENITIDLTPEVEELLLSKLLETNLPISTLISKILLENLKKEISNDT